MNEDTNLIFDYLPSSYETPDEQNYIEFLWSSFESNYESEKYQFAFLCYHLLFMSSIYFKILQIKKIQPANFKKVLIGTNKNIEKTFLNATSAFTFSEMKERSIFRFFKLIGCSDSEIGRFSKLVDDRNDVAHPNGNVFYKEQEILDRKITEINSSLNIIQLKFNKLILKQFKKFLLDYNNSDNWEITDFTEQINKMLIQRNHFSKQDFDMCLNYDVFELKKNKDFSSILRFFLQIKSKFTNGMIEQLENLYHKYDEQKKSYELHKLTIDEKYGLIYYFLENRKFWGYFQLITDIALELSENSDRFITLLSDLEDKVKGDMAQKPFLDLLILLGSKDFGLKLYESIMKKKSLTDNFKIISGLMLGGYYLKNKQEKITFRLKESLKFPNTNCYLKALLVIYENKKLDSLIKKFLNNVSKSNNKEILEEFTFTSLYFYQKDPIFFYQHIKKLVLLNEFNISWNIFNKLNYKDLFTKKEVFELIEIAKNYDLKIIDEIMGVLKKFPSEHKNIFELIIYWINKHEQFEFNSQNFRWIIEELFKDNKFFIKELFDHYKEIIPDKKLYLFTFPHIFEIVSKYHKEYSLKHILNFKLTNDDDKHLFYKLCEVFIGNIYSDSKNKELCIKLNKTLIKLAKKRGFISFNENLYTAKIKKGIQSIDDYNYIIDISKKLVNQLRSRKEKYDFELIRTNIAKYPELKKVSKDAINVLESKKQFSSLIWLGETEEPIFDEEKAPENESELNKALRLSYIRNKFWSRAYLKAMNSSIKKYLNLPNQKVSNKYDKIKKELINEDSFWSFESELIFIDKFSKKQIIYLEPQVPNRSEKNLDLQIKLFKKDIFFEIKRPKMDRNLDLNNGAVAMPNKALQTIDKKFRQLMAKKTLEEMKEGKRNDLFFIVIDTSNSTVDEYQILNAFHGSLSFTWTIDKKTGKPVDQYTTRQKDAIHDKNVKTDIVSGVIYFKQELMFDKENQPYIKLIGDVLQNPNAINSLNEKELINLKKIIFD